MRNSVKQSSLKTFLLVAASGFALNGFVGERAFAQCSPASPSDGDTVTCAPGAYSALTFTVNDLTVVVGTAGGSASITSGSSSAISLSGSDDQRLTVRNSASVVQSTSDHGIYVNATGGTGSVVVTSDASIYGYNDGIHVAGGLTAGQIRITANGLIDATYGEGIRVATTSATTSVVIEATNDIIAGGGGVFVSGSHTGQTSVTVANVYASGVADEGIYVRATNAGHGLITVYSDYIRSQSTSISIGSFGSGDTTVTSGDIWSIGGDGIYVFNQVGGNVDITSTGNIQASVNAVDVIQASGGTTNVHVNTAASATANGVYIVATATAGDVSVTGGGSISGNQHGVRVSNYGTGRTILDTQAVSSTTNSADIYLTTGSTTTGLELTLGGNITSEVNGVGINTAAALADTSVFADHAGGGDIELTVNGNIEVTAEGIYISSNASTTGINLTTNGSVFAQTDGVDIRHAGTGTINVGFYDNVTAVLGGAADVGVRLANSASGTDINVMSTGTISGAQGGLFVTQQGSGQTNLTVNNAFGDSAAGEYGLFITAGASASDINVSVTGLAAGYHGIYVQNYGTGSTNIDAFQARSDNQTYADIVAIGGATTTDMTVMQTYSATSTLVGVGVNQPAGTTLNTGTYITHNGTGALHVGAGGADGGLGYGILAQSAASSSHASFVMTGSVDGGLAGANIIHYGSGNLDVQLTDADSNNTGVRLQTSQNSQDLTFTSTGLLEGRIQGAVSLHHYGSGDASINLNSITSTNDEGLFAAIQSAGDVEVNVADIQAVTYGVYLASRFSYGVYTAGFTDVSVGDVYLTGVGAQAIRVNLSGTDQGYGALTSGGIRVSHSGTINRDVTVIADHVYNASTPSSNGIDVTVTDSVDVDIDINGDVFATRFGVVTNTVDGATLTIAAGASLSGGTAGARMNGVAAADDVRLSGTVNSDLLTLGGSDNLIIFSGGDIGAGARIDLGTGDDFASINGGIAFSGDLRGGLGYDTLIMSGGTWTDSGRVGNRVRQFEEVGILGAPTTLAGVHFNYDRFTFSGAGHQVTGRIFADSIEIFNGASVDLADGAFLSRTIVALDGVLDIAGSGTTGASSVTGTLNVGSTGVINIDAVASGDNDLLRLTGAFAGQGTINIDGGATLNLNQTYALETGQYTIINAVQELNGTFGTVNGLGSGGGLEQSLVYNTTNNTVRVLTQTTGMMPTDTGSKSSASAANYLLGLMGDTSEYAQLGFNVGTIVSVAEIGDFASGITPDILDSAVMVGNGAALRFAGALAGCDMNFSLNSAESCAASEGQSGPAMFGEIRQTSANTGTEIGHNFNAQSFDMTMGLRLTDADDQTQFGLMSGYTKSGSVSDALAGENRDGLEAESFSLGGYVRRDAGWWSLDGTAMVSTSEAKLVRNITPGLGIAEQANAEFVSRQFNLQGTATLNGLGSTEFAIKPLATLGNRALQRDGFTESGADLLGLTVDGQTRNVSYAGLGVEFAPDFTDEAGNGFKGLLRVTGLAYAGGTENNFSARFTNAPTNNSFTYFGQNLDTSVLLEGGFQYLAGDGFAIGAEGFGEVNPETGDSSSVGATLQLIKRW